MMSRNRSNEGILVQLAAGLAAGSVRVVDLTTPLGTETPTLPLPPYPNSPSFEIREISRYDERGPGWCWNSFVTDETCCARRGADLERR